MTYVLSDIHGCYEQYRKMLEKIHFADNDVLYVVGDVVDRGPEPMKVLRDMSMRSNIIPILGNHDHVAHAILSRLLLELNEENIRKHFGHDLENFFMEISTWTSEDFGGQPTLEGFRKLSMDEKRFMIEYISEFSLYEIVKAGGKNFILTHIGLPAGAAPGNLEKFDAYDFTGPDVSIDYGREYFKNIFLVTGHTPTFGIGEEYRGRIYRAHNHIAIDTGAVFGEVMGCVCLETGEEFYVK